MQISGELDDGGTGGDCRGRLKKLCCHYCGKPFVSKVFIFGFKSQIVCRSVVSWMVEGQAVIAEIVLKSVVVSCHYCGKLFNEHDVYILVKNPNIFQIDGKSISGGAGGDYLDLKKR